MVIGWNAANSVVKLIIFESLIGHRTIQGIARERDEVLAVQ